MTVIAANRARVRGRGVSAQGARSGDPLFNAACLLAAALVAALTPLARGVIAPEYFNAAVAGLAVIFVLLGRAAAPVGAAVWLSAVPLIGFGVWVGGPASLKTGTLLILTCAVLPFAVRGLEVNVPSLRKVAAGAFLVSQTFSAVVGIAQYLGAQPLGVLYYFGRAQGLAGHPNVLGLMAGMAVLVTLDALIRGLASRALCTTVLILNLTALVASGSLSSLAATVAGLSVLLWTHRKMSVVTLAVLALLPIGYLVAVRVPVLGNLVDTVGYRSDVVLGRNVPAADASVDVRLRTYQYAIDYLKDSPVYGVGLQPDVAGTFNGVTVVHNFFLRAWYQGGITHALWFVLLLAVLLVRIIVPAITRRDVELALPAAGTLLILVFASTAAFFDDVQYWLPLIFFIAMAKPSGTTGFLPGGGVPILVLPASRSRDRALGRARATIRSD